MVELGWGGVWLSWDVLWLSWGGGGMGIFIQSSTPFHDFTFRFNLMVTGPSSFLWLSYHTGGG